MMLNESGVWQIAQAIMPPNATGDDAFHETLMHDLTQPVRRVYSVDTFVENRHFRLDWQPPDAVAWRCLAASISDIAACGANPLGFLIGLSLPGDVTPEAVAQFYNGLKQFCDTHAPNLELWGGDTTRAEAWVISITVIGEVEAHVQLKRNAARASDVLLASGAHGLAALGLHALEAKQTPKYPNALERFTHPIPRLAAGRALASLVPHAALMDTSDGLADAALKIASASHCRAVLEASKLALHPELKTLDAAQALQYQLYGGEDFELLAALPPTDWDRHQSELTALGFHVVGYLEAGHAANSFIKGTDGQAAPLDAAATFQHFGDCTP